MEGRVKPLTEKQKAVWDLREEGKSNKDVAAVLGVTENVIRKTMAVARKKMGVTDASEQANKARRVENTTPPETQAAIIDAMSEPLMKLKDALAECGLPESISKTLISRIRVKYSNSITQTRNLKSQEILDLLGNKIHLGLNYLDDHVMAAASARDIMLGLGVMIEKRQLLRGEPTAIVTDLERRKLNDLLPALIAESKRRGITYEGEVVGSSAT